MRLQDDHLQELVDGAVEWLARMVGTLEQTSDDFAFSSDPVADIEVIASLRPKFEAAGIAVPAIAEAAVDPVGAVYQWRDFLSTFVTVH